MKKILLFMWYLTGFIIGSKFTKKSEKKWTKKVKNIGESTIDVGKDFIESHKKAFQELKKEYWTEENKKLVLSRKKDLEKFFILAKQELLEAKETLKKHGINTDTISQELQSIYTSKKGFIETLWDSPTAKKAKRKLSTIVSSIKKNI